MQVCEYCSDEPAYEDRDGIECWCEEHYQGLDKEDIKTHGIRKI